MDMKYELSEIIDLKPVLLYKNDLIELEEILASPSAYNEEHTEIIVRDKEKSITAKTIAELLAASKLPEFTDKLSIRKTYWIKKDGKNDIGASINITLHHNYVRLQISSTDEDWYKGKLARLNSFFSAKKPWYSFLNRFAYLLPLPVTFFLGVDIFRFLVYGGVLPIYEILLATILICMTFLIISQRIFPYVRVVLIEKKDDFLGSIKLQNILAIIAILLAVWQIIEKIFFLK